MKPSDQSKVKSLSSGALGGLSERLSERWVSQLPADERAGGPPRQVWGAAYSFVEPSEPPAPRLISVSESAAQLIGLGAEELASPDFVALMSGAASLSGARPFAHAYGGHQFGHWAGQLGDGRAISIAELRGLDEAGEPMTWECQLKGAGRTPYSRSGDGRAVMRSSLREYVCSEAMHALGVPTTRALSLVDTGERVWRDMLYDGNPAPEPGAVVCRMAPSFVRFGHFELPASRGDRALLSALVEATISAHFSELSEGLSDPEERVCRWFLEVSERTLRLCLDWMSLGFVHGVMNTDNMSILGLTIDYGPYGWVDDFDLSWTPNSSDAAERRYRFGAQGHVARWNLSRLASAIAPLIPKRAERLIEELESWPERFREGLTARYLSKIGLSGAEAQRGLEGLGWSQEACVGELLELLNQGGVDMTLFFRQLSELRPAAAMSEEALSRAQERLGELERSQAPLWAAPLLGALYHEDEGGVRADHPKREELWSWLTRYLKLSAELTQAEGAWAERERELKRINPLIVPRNYLSYQAAQALDEGDPEPLRQLIEALREPYRGVDGDPVRGALSLKRPAWALTRPGCSTLSCSS